MKVDVNLCGKSVSIISFAASASSYAVCISRNELLKRFRVTEGRVVYQITRLKPQKKNFTNVEKVAVLGLLVMQLRN